MLDVGIQTIPWEIPGAADVAPVTTMASAMLFGTITFATVAMGLKSYLSGDAAPFKAAQNPRSSPLEIRSFSSIYTLFHHVTILGLILFYAYLSEYHPPYPHSEKSYDRDEFFFLTALLFLVSAFTLSRHEQPENDAIEHSSSSGTEKAVAPPNDATELLNRDQTEEWKGWMQFMFLLYHYYHAEEVYNSIRIMITCYVWMTGFGNFSFFYLKGDFSAVRVMQMLWRLNFLVICLCLTQGTTYILYYICLLHTYFFLVVYVVMRIQKGSNYTKWGIRRKLAVLAVIIFLVWDVDLGIFRLIHFPFLGETPMLGAGSGAMWEWYFRSSLDHWSTFLGMVFALNFPITSLFFRKLEAQPLHLHILAKGILSVFFLGIFYWWVTGPFSQGKLEYNATNAYFGFIPLLVYIFFRNLTPYLRGCTLQLLHQIGKTTLETYLMQHHIWLTSNAKSLLTLIPGWPKMNFLLVTCIYFLLSRRLYQLTLFLRGMLLPNDRDACYRNLMVLGLVIASYLGLAVVLKVFGLLNLTVAAVFSIVLGYKVYETATKQTWTQYAPSPSSASQAEKIGNKEWKKPLPVVLACASVLMVGIVWQRASLHGAAKIKSLPAACAAHVNDGMWVALDSCSEEVRGVSYRNSAVDRLGTCSAGSPNYVWGWKEVDASTHCRFQNRDPKTLKKILKKRKITFMGDSISRNLYHSFARQMGETNAGAYDTSLEKHSDQSRNVAKSCDLEFKWLPYIADQVAALKMLLQKDSSEYPDLVVLSGGPWDCRDQTKANVLQNTASDLKNQLVKATEKGLSVAWLVPTTINSDALPIADGKKVKLHEDKLQGVRDIIKGAGVLDAASFVIDGPSFSSERVKESYDGVHYPFTVYDAGAQILANGMDWALPEPKDKDPFVPPRPGSMAHPILGLGMLMVVFMGVFFFDAFAGVSYLASFFVPSVMPMKLYEEAFSSLHKRAGLPDIDYNEQLSVVASLQSFSTMLMSTPVTLAREFPRIMGQAKAILLYVFSFFFQAFPFARAKTNHEEDDDAIMVGNKSSFVSQHSSAPVDDKEIEALINGTDQSSAGSKEG